MSSNKGRKYIFINGVMTLNPEYSETKSNTSTNTNTNTNTANKTNTITVTPLAIISSENDILIAKEVKLEEGGSVQQEEEELPQTTLNAIHFMQTEEYNSYFQTTSLSNTTNPTHTTNNNSTENNQVKNLFEELCHYFIIYEIPIGLISKLFVLKDYRLNFMVDDSGLIS